MRITTLVTMVSALFVCGSAQAEVVGHGTSIIQLESGPSQNFVVKRLSVGGKTEDDMNQADEIASQGDQEALNEMIIDGKIHFFEIGTQLYPVKSANFLGTMWLVREKGSTDV